MITPFPVPTINVTPASAEFKLFYNVYVLEYFEDIGLPYQYALFVEINDNNRKGIIFRVNSNIKDGLECEEIRDEDPQYYRHFASMECIGSVKCTKFSDFRELCAEVAAPEEPIRSSDDWCIAKITILKAKNVLESQA
jgi:hypothetical protein